MTFYYTDISSSFTRYGEKKLKKQYSWVNFERLNIEEDPADQGFELESFDIIYASNVLHDTKYLTNTLHQVKRLLKSGGLLVLNEFTRMKDILYYTGGLLHGWWLFEDPEYRLENTCLLSVDQWRSILEMSGFEHFEALGLPYQNESSEYRQSVMFCELSQVEHKIIPSTAQKMAISKNKVWLTEPEAIVFDEDIGKQEWISGVIKQSLYDILGEKRMQDLLPNSPFMEAGMDSLELLEFRTLLSKKFEIDLDAPFLFQYNTLEKIVHYMEKQHLWGKKKETVEKVTKDEPKNQEKSIIKRLKIENKKGDIAIVGIAFRFPGGIHTNEDFWSLLREGKSAIGPMPKERWQWPFNVDIKGEKAYLIQGGFLPGIDEFDASFFRISPKEAEFMDPQQRMLLELSWGVMEDAGYKASDLWGSETGIYVGACHFEYRKLLEEKETLVEAYLATGTNGSILANRLSYFYDFQGPSMLVDTACSSSLAAVHEAVRGLRQGKSAQAFPPQRADDLPGPLRVDEPPPHHL